MDFIELNVPSERVQDSKFECDKNKREKTHNTKSNSNDVVDELT